MHPLMGQCIEKAEREGLVEKWFLVLCFFLNASRGHPMTPLLEPQTLESRYF